METIIKAHVHIVLMKTVLNGVMVIVICLVDIVSQNLLKVCYTRIEIVHFLLIFIISHFYS